VVYLTERQRITATDLVASRNPYQVRLNALRSIGAGEEITA